MSWKIIEKKVQIEKGNKSPKRIREKKMLRKKKQFLRPQCEIAVKKMRCKPSQVFSSIILSSIVALSLLWLGQKRF